MVLYSYDLYSHGVHSYGLHSYMAYIVMAYIVMANIVMAAVTKYRAGASEDSAFINGQSIVCDGGMSNRQKNSFCV